MTPKELAAELREAHQKYVDFVGPGTRIIESRYVADVMSPFFVFVSKNYDTILAALEAHEPWVKCSERLPKKDCEVLGFSPAYGISVWVYGWCDFDNCHLWWLMTGSSGPSNDDIASFDADEAIVPTHWKPLSKPPEGV